MSVNRVRPIDIHLFPFTGGRLMFQHSKTARNRFFKDEQGNATKADGYWPGLVVKKGSAQGFSGTFDEAAQ